MVKQNPRQSLESLGLSVEPLVRLELTTYWLQVSCSTNWATAAFLLVTRTGIEPMSPPWKGDVLTAWPTGHKYEWNKLLYFIHLVSYPRLERGTTWLKVKCSTTWANSPCHQLYKQPFFKQLLIYITTFFCICQYFL